MDIGSMRVLQLFQEKSGKKECCASSFFVRYTAKQLLISTDWKLARQRIRKEI